jgi:hypothetical protein
VLGSPENVRVRNYANRWHTMVLAETCQLKTKSLIAIIHSVEHSSSDGGNGVLAVTRRSRPGARLTDSNFLSKVKKLGRETGNNSWFATAHFLHLPRLGGRTIGSTSASGADYPGSSPGLPAKLAKALINR